MKHISHRRVQSYYRHSFSCSETGARRSFSRCKSSGCESEDHESGVPLPPWKSSLDPCIDEWQSL